MKIVTAAEMREIDRLTTEKYGVPSLTLMENAGSAVAEFAQKHFDFSYVCVVCGKGNNGGDGFVAARKLQEAGKQVSVIVLAKSADELRGDAAEMFKRIQIQPLWIAAEENFNKVDIQQALESGLLIDAIVGTGFRPPLQGLGRKAVEIINNYAGKVLAVDLPSGAYSDSFLIAKGQGLVAKADGVITFTAPKTVHAFGGITSGPMAVAPIGTEKKLIEQTARTLRLQIVTSENVAEVFPAREPDAHKGDFGHVLVVGGSVGKAGAAAMAGIAALRTGAGLVTVASPRSIQPSVTSFAPELMTEPLPETGEGTLALHAIDHLKQLLKGKDVVVLGPGLSRNPETAETIRRLLPALEVPVVLDADGLNAFEDHGEQLQNESGLILTPHPGEMARISGSRIGADPQARLKVVRQAASRHKAMVVLKGHRTLTASPTGEVWVNTSGNPGMAKGGSGDILSGMIAATAYRLSQGARSEHDWAAMIVATTVYAHGLAGDIARDLHGEYSLMATDIADNVGEAIAVCREEANQKFIYLQR